MSRFGATPYFGRRGRITSVADLHSNDLIGLDERDTLIGDVYVYDEPIP